MINLWNTARTVIARLKTTTLISTTPASRTLGRLAFASTIIHIVFILWQIVSNSPTRNEVAHVPAGVTYLTTADFSLYNVNPPLTKVIQAIPLVLAGSNNEGLLLVAQETGRRREFAAGRAFAKENLSRHAYLIRLARLTGIFWALLGIFVLRKLCSVLYGRDAANFATILWCFSPNILAHASVATPDFPCAISFLCVSYVATKYVGSPTRYSAFQLGVSLGLAQLVKFTCLVLFPATILFVTISFLKIRAAGLVKTPRTNLLVHLLVSIFASLAAINLGYLGEGVGTKLGDFDFRSQSLSFKSISGFQENLFSNSVLKSIPIPLPANYVRGIDAQQVHFQGEMESYLAGELRKGGWWYFYIYAMFVKVPLGSLCLFCISVPIAMKNTRIRQKAWVCWIPCVVLFVVASSKAGFTMHFRYVLPVIPLLIAGSSFILNCKSSLVQVTARLLLVSTILSSVVVSPFWLSYFNELAGGPKNGSRHLIDSNIDWGQDLYRLRNWLYENENKEPIFVGYVNYVPIETILDKDVIKIPEDVTLLVPGYYAIDIESRIVRGHSYFTEMQAVDRIGYSVNVYYLSETDIRRIQDSHRFDK